MLLCLMPLALWAQRPRYEKMSPLLRQLARQQVTVAATGGKHAAAVRQGEICAFVKTTTPQALTDHGCKELARVGQISIAAVPISQLGIMSLDARVLRMEARQHNSLANDQMATHLNALPVYEGLHLPQAYTGRGVIVGLMDIGFDLTHPTFYSPDTTDYRIRQFWDMLSADTLNSPFYVGRDYVGRDALLTLGHSRDGVDQAHGTHTAGTAAGSGYNAPYRGMAPEADICLVANAVTDDTIYIDPADYYKYTFATDALGFKYMFDYAKQVGKPCVLSFSEGSVQDFHGYDQLYYELLDSLVGPGRIIVAAAGNYGHYRTWFCKPVGVEAMGTFIYNDKPSLDFILKSASDFTLRMVTYGEHNDTTLIPTSRVLDLKDSLLVLPGLTVEAYPSCYVPEEVCYDVSVRGDKNVGISPRLSVEILGADAYVEFWRVNGVLSSNGLNPQLNAGEKVGSVLSPGSAPRVICVGATSYRDSILNAKGEWLKFGTDENGVRSIYSSVGPTFDGRMKPDVMAPGINVVSSYNSFFAEHHPTSGNLQWDVAHFDFKGRTYAWNANSGTSMACPAVAGAIALWLQAKPDLTPEQVLEVLHRTCRQPDPSLSYPNNYYGHGEIDVYAGLLDILGANRIQELSVRHSPARISYADGMLRICLNAPASSSLQLRLFNMSGSQIMTTKLPAGQSDYAVPLTRQPSGIYAVQLDGSPSVQGSTLIRL